MVRLLISIRPFSPNPTVNPTVLATSDRNPTILMASVHPIRPRQLLY